MLALPWRSLLTDGFPTLLSDYCLELQGVFLHWKFETVYSSIWTISSSSDPRTTNTVAFIVMIIYLGSSVISCLHMNVETSKLHDVRGYAVYTQFFCHINLLRGASVARSLCSCTHNRLILIYMPSSRLTVVTHHRI